MFKKKYGSYSEKKKRNQAIKVGAIVVITTLCVSGIYQFIVLDFYGKRVRENTIAELTNKDGGYITTYVLNKDIGQGKEIKAEDLTQITQNKDMVPDSCITDLKQLKDMVTRIELKKKSVPTLDMFNNKDDQITDEVKNQDFNWIRMHAFLEVDNYVDIHYKEKDGTDYVVAAKKKIINLSGNTFSTNITDEERPLINNATVRADVTGGTLYLTIYPEPQNQDAARVTYVLDKNIQEKIESQPEIVQKSAQSLAKKNNTSTSYNTNTSSNSSTQNANTVNKDVEPTEPPVIDDSSNDNKPNFAKEEGQ